MVVVVVVVVVVVAVAVVVEVRVVTLLTSKCSFVPQRRALFRHLKFQKWSENGVFCTF